MDFNYGQWASAVAAGPFVTSGPKFAGISGGRTSGMMASLLAEDTVLTFQNTGREHPGTYDFLEALDDALGHRLVLLEFRMPRVKGARPRDFEFAVVSHRTMDRRGRPFEEWMRAIADYRETKGEGPISPWARQRLCTNYMKHNVERGYITSLGVDAYDKFVGLRADEEQRVNRLMEKNTQRCALRAPLYKAGITKEHVNEFWEAQVFNLNIAPYQGNCTGCFLKDQSDLARVLQEPETDAAWWIALESLYDDFGGRDFVGYERLRREGPERLRIEAALRCGETPVSSGLLEPRRFHLVVLQEKRRLRGETPTYACACEATIPMEDE